MNQCSQPSWSKLNTAAMLHDVFSVTKTHYVLSHSNFKFYIHEYLLENEIKDEDICNEVRVLIDEKKINLVSDSSMLEELKKNFMDEESAIRLFDSFLSEVCASFGRNYYFENFGGKLDFTSCTSFVSSLHECENNIGIDHNLGELNCAITLKMMEMIRTSSETIMFMCSDDRKARNVLLSMNQDSVKYQCHTTGSSFVSIFHQGLKKRRCGELYSKILRKQGQNWSKHFFCIWTKWKKRKATMFRGFK